MYAFFVWFLESARKSKKSANATTRRRSVPKKSSQKSASVRTVAKAKPKTAQLKKSKDKENKKKPKKIKSTSKGKSSDLKASASTSPVARKEKKVRARIIRAPSSIPAVFSRQVRQLNQAFDEMYQRQGRHIRSRRSVTVLQENATFPAMMHSISIISPIEDLDDKELDAWEKMLQLEGKAEEVSLLEAITKLPTVTDSGYCFTAVNLFSATLLLTAIVMILSISVAMTCMHLQTRASSGKEAALY